MTTKIGKCTCVNAFQDATYGSGRRVFNKRHKERKPLGWVCAVCDAKHPLVSGEEDAVTVKKK